MKLSQNLKLAIDASIQAGKKIIEIYNSDNFNLEYKLDDSPLTLADTASNKIIENILKASKYLLIFCMALTSISAREMELVSVELIKGKAELNEKPQYESITCAFELIFSLEHGTYELAIRLDNTSDKTVKVSKLQMCMDAGLTHLGWY